MSEFSCSGTEIGRDDRPTRTERQLSFYFGRGTDGRDYTRQRWREQEQFLKASGPKYLWSEVKTKGGDRVMMGPFS